jgi:alpha/beta hydrolase fold
MIKKTQMCLTKLGNSIGKIVYDLYDNHEHSMGLICLHNNMGNKCMFEELAEDLCKHTNVIVPDMVGRGGSAVGAPGQYHMEQYLQDCIGIMNSIGMKQAIILGNGLGAKIALNLAKLSNSPVVSVIVDQIDYQYENLIQKINTSSHKNMESIALAVQEIVNDPQCTFDDYLDFVVRNVKMIGQRIVPIYDLSLDNHGTEESSATNYSSLVDSIKGSVLVLNEGNLVSDKCTVKEILSSQSNNQNRLRVKYSAKERKAISEWIRNLSSTKEKLKSHFAIDTGSSKAKAQA